MRSDPRARVVGEPERAVQHRRARPCRRRTACRRARARRPRSGRSRAPTRPARSGRAAGSPRRARGDELDRVDDLHVARAPAEVPEQGVRDLLARRLGVLRQQRLGLHHDPRRAEAALRRAGGDEARPPTAARVVVGEPLLRDDALALDPRRLLRARDARPGRRRSPCTRRTSPPARSRPSPSAAPRSSRSSSSRLCPSRGSATTCCR